MYSHRLPNVCVFCELYCLQYVFYALCKAFVCAVLFCSSFQPSWLTSFCLLFMYPTLLYHCLLENLFVICLYQYLCLPNPIWGCYVPGRTHTIWRYSIIVCIILLCFSFLVMCGFISPSGHYRKKSTSSVHFKFSFDFFNILYVWCFLLFSFFFKVNSGVFLITEWQHWLAIRMKWAQWQNDWSIYINKDGWHCVT